MFDHIIEHVIRTEGGYVSNANDLGGETMFGITKATAAAYGYHGPMRDMPVSLARKIYGERYITVPGFDRVATRSAAIAEELIDTGVNIGVEIAARFLQQALNSFNDQGKHYADVIIDDKIGPATLNALDSYLAQRGRMDGERVMLTALNCLQGARYIQISEARPKNESFTFGWIKNRCTISPITKGA